MTTTATQNIQETARETVIQSDDIQKDIRQLVIQALKEGELDPEAIKQTLHSVLEGASEGSNSQFDKNTEALEQVVTGIDAALGQVAEVSKLAIEEASGNLQDFSDHDLKRALNDLQDLESLFFDTLSEVAHKGKDKTGETLVGLLEHLQNSGSSVGESATKILTDLHHDLSKNGRLEKIQAAGIADSLADKK
ncbi:MAG TPA: hypothetical protein EYQ43_07845 [Methyloprofundus sp.]|nr:hypothetical protein [Methyloprofundus sp.]